LLEAKRDLLSVIANMDRQKSFDRILRFARHQHQVSPKSAANDLSVVFGNGKWHLAVTACHWVQSFFGFPPGPPKKKKK